MPTIIADQEKKELPEEYVPDVTYFQYEDFLYLENTRERIRNLHTPQDSLK